VIFVLFIINFKNAKTPMLFHLHYKNTKGSKYNDQEIQAIHQFISSWIIGLNIEGKKDTNIVLKRE